MKCPNCGAEMVLEARYVESIMFEIDARPLPIFCPVCGTEGHLNR